MKRLILITIIFMVVMAGCGRDTSTTKNGLLGHWDNGLGDLYLSDNHFIRVAKDGTIIEKEYSVLSRNDKKRQILIRILKDDEGNGLAYDIKFSSDYKKAIVKVNLAESKFNKEDAESFKDVNQEDIETSEWKYIDDKERND